MNPPKGKTAIVQMRVNNHLNSLLYFNNIEPMLNPLVLLLCVETLDGSPLPEKFLTIPNCHDFSMECGEEEPYKVELLSAYEACLTYKENVIIADLAIKLMAVERGQGYPLLLLQSY